MKLDWQWPAALVFMCVFVTLGTLVYFKILHTEVLLAMLTWLAPSPYQSRAEVSTVTTKVTSTEIIVPSEKEESGVKDP